MESAKPSILILHGWGKYDDSWIKTKEILEGEGCIVLYPPLPGLDKSQPLDKPWAINDYVEWTKNYVEKNNLDRFFLLGHSFGGRVGIKFAIKYPEKLNGLILVSAAGIRNRKMAIFYNLISRLAKVAKIFSFLPGYNLIKKFFYKFIFKTLDYARIESLDGLMEKTMKETFKKVIEEDLTPYLPQIETKVLILWGENDKITPLSNAKLMKASIPNSRLKTFPGGGHKSYLDSPEKLTQEIRDFVFKARPWN